MPLLGEEMANEIVIKERKDTIEKQSNKLAILERLAQGDITVRESWKLLEELERTRTHIMDFEDSFTNPIAQQELKRLVLDKITICRNREKSKLKDCFAET
jgi:hypothetical protein